MTGPVVACKDSVRFGGFTPALCRILTAVCAVAGKRELRDQLQCELGPQFSVLLEHEGREQEHLHVQVARGHQYEAEAA